jgi:hypothetical protein
MAVENFVVQARKWIDKTRGLREKCIRIPDRHPTRCGNRTVAAVPAKDGGDPAALTGTR